MTTRRRTAGTAALFLAAVGLSFGAGEVAVRILRPAYDLPDDPIRNPLWRHDSEIGWLHEPGSEGVLEREEFSHHVRINGLGWRDRERTLEKPPGTFRILTLGDSFTWGHGVEDGEIFTLLAEGLLPGVEVVNLGLSASSTDQQWIILRRFGLAYHPDLVLVMLSRNDFMGNTEDRAGLYHKPRYTLGPDGRLLLENVPVPRYSSLERLNDRLRRRSALLNLVESVFEGSTEVDREALRSQRAESYRITEALLLAVRDEARGAGARFAVGLVPSTSHTYPDEIPVLEAKRFDEARALGEEAGFPVLDLVPAFREGARDPVTGGRVMLHYRRDRHWNAAGHALAARELARLLRDAGLVPFENE